MHAAAGLAQRRRRALADVAEAGDHRDLAGHHHVGAAADAVDQRFAAAIEIVELRLGDAVIDVDRREQQPAFLFHLIEPMDAGRRLLRDAADILGGLGVPAGLFLQPLRDRGEQHLFLFVVRVMQHLRSLFRLDAEMQEQRGVAAVIEDHVRRAAVGPFEDAVGVFPVFRERFALDREHRGAGRGDGGGGVVLRRIDVARGPADVGAERRERLDQDAGLNGHVQRAGDARAAQRLLGPVFFARRHQTGHFGLGDGKFLAAPFGEAEILDDVVGVRSFGLGRRAHGNPWRSLAIVR